jgi:DNA-binding CsgD family transcriptional regulator
MSHRPDPLSTIETAYRIDLPMEKWLDRMGESVYRLLGGGEGLVSFEFDAAEDNAPVELGPLRRAGGTSPRLWERSRIFHQQMSGSAYRLLFPDSSRHSIHCPVTRHLRHLGLDPARFPPLVDLLSDLGVPELWSLWAVVNGERGVGLVRAMPDPERSSTRPSEWWQRLGTHIAAGYRVRLSLDGADPLEAAAGVFRPDGTPLSVADTEQFRIDTWSRIVRSIDRARADDYRTGDDTILDVWNGIIDGRWSLHDHVDTDGKRYVILVETEGTPRAQRGRLTPREVQVCLGAARGLTNKEIAYDLNVSLSSVATYLRRALRKLEINDRADLQRLGPMLPQLAESDESGQDPTSR